MSSPSGGRERLFSTKDRRDLFLEMARVTGGTTASAVYQRASSEGDKVTEEAYYMLARRLEHRGLLTRQETPQGARFITATTVDGQWLEEDELAALVDAEYPLLALSVWKEASRLTSDIPEPVWVELRERLRNEDARRLFERAIVSYCDEFHAQVGYLNELKAAPDKELPRLRQEADGSLRLLVQLAKYGLGLSKEAVDLPLNLDRALATYVPGPTPYVDRGMLVSELSRRVAPGPFLVEAEASSTRNLVLVAVDGSTRGGMLSFEAEGGDFNVGHAPMIAINTSVAQVNRRISLGRREVPVFLRLPEKPEDMQRQDNRYTVMAKLLYSDQSDAQYMHSLWNAMDLIEARVALRVLQRWYHPSGNIEIPAADVVLRDGAAAPQERDFNHYCDVSSYGQIARDMIGTNWDIAKRCRDDDQTFGGVVKHAQLNVFGPVVNWFACEVARGGGSQIEAWPMRGMNVVPDQVVLTRLLTAQRGKADPWLRTTLVVRPFFAITNYGKTYSRTRPPWDIIDGRHRRILSGEDEIDDDARQFWEGLFRPGADPYVQMLRNVSYGSFFLAAVPRLDTGKSLPRLEFMVVAPTGEDASDHWGQAGKHAGRMVQALRQDGFDVSAEHNMFDSAAQLDVLPKLLINAHETVKLWAAELMSRFQEFIGFQLSSYVNAKRLRGVKVRPFTKGEIELLYEQLRRQRERKAGGGPLPQMPPRDERGAGST